MELNKMMNPSTQKTSFDLRLPYDPQSKCNKFILKGYSMCICLLNIAMKIVITIAVSAGVVLILFSQIEPNILPKDIKMELFNQSLLTTKYQQSNLKILHFLMTIFYYLNDIFISYCI